MTTLRGRVSWFGGPEDLGVSPSEGLAFYYSVDDAPQLFLDEQPSGTTGLARRLNPETFYIATRWDYSVTPKEMLPDMRVRVHAVKTGKRAFATPADWGPHEDTNRIADVSPRLLAELGIETDDEVIVEFEPTGVSAMPYSRIVISSGHSKYCRGASGVLDEVDEARRVTERVADESIDENGFVRQTLSAKNGTPAPIEWLNFECGFLRGNQLMATGVHYLQNLQPGQTGYQTVTVRIITQGDFPDHADCRMSLPGR